MVISPCFFFVARNSGDALKNQATKSTNKGKNMEDHFVVSNNVEAKSMMNFFFKFFLLVEKIHQLSRKHYALSLSLGHQPSYSQVVIGVLNHLFSIFTPTKMNECPLKRDHLLKGHFRGNPTINFQGTC